jgi:hypothetical protein
LDVDEPELMAFEVETFESTILFEPLDNRGNARSSSSGLGRSTTSGPTSQPGKKESAPGRDKPASKPPSILDPLFDEDD